MMYLAILAVIALTAYCILFAFKHREKLSCMAGMMIAMTIAMMGSVTLGTLLGIVFERDLVPASMIAILFGMLAGYLAGKPISLMAAMDGVMAGIMGGMMGAMLGVMLIEPERMVWFVMTIFAFIMFMLIRLINEESGNKKKEINTVRKSFLGNPVMVISFLLLAGIIILGGQVSGLFNVGKTVSKTIDRITPADQEATITVSSKGYAPTEIKLKAGSSAKINFKTEANAGCLRQVVAKDLGVNVILDEEADNYITLKDLKSGTYEYTCGMGMYGGKIVVQ